jgi:hypothetical protein
VHLARPANVRAIKARLGRSLDGTHPEGSHIRGDGAARPADQLSDEDRRLVFRRLAELGIDLGPVERACPTSSSP